MTVMALWLQLQKATYSYNAKWIFLIFGDGWWWDFPPFSPHLLRHNIARLFFPPFWKSALLSFACCFSWLVYLDVVEREVLYLRAVKSTINHTNYYRHPTPASLA
jgi:hypothetical protein